MKQHSNLATINVLIVPLWNWNRWPMIGEYMKRSVLIVPLWNWNEQDVTDLTPFPRFNRTFMELKCDRDSQINIFYRVLIVPLWNWNRWLVRFYSSQCYVLIVPLWNWNLFFLSLLETVLWCFNRTFMELKSKH